MFTLTVRNSPWVIDVGLFIDDRFCHNLSNPSNGKNE
jgi:hypothetical protein